MHEGNVVGVPCVEPFGNVVEFAVKSDASGGGVVGGVVAVGVDVGGGAVVNVSLFGVSFDFSGVGGCMVFVVDAFEKIVPHVAVVL